MKTGNAEYSEEHTRRRADTRHKRKTYVTTGTNGKDSENNNPNMGLDTLYENNQDCVSCHGLELDRSKNKFVVIVLNAQAI